MTVNLAEYEATIRRLDSGLAELSRLVHQLPAAAAAAAGRWYMTDAMSHSLTRLTNALTGAGAHGIAQVRDLMKGAAAPFLLISEVRIWGEVRGVATTFVGELQPVALSVDYYWRGRASEAYRSVIPANTAAATRIGVMADKTQTALGWSVSAALAFYAGLLVVVIQLIVGFVGVLAILGTVVFSWAGLVLAIRQAAVGWIEVGVLTALLASALGTQVVQLGNLHSEAADLSAFPGGHWPGSSTDRYSDATVIDGDAEWSVER
jgi:hypothetical protein